MSDMERETHNPQSRKLEKTVAADVAEILEG